MSLTAVHSAAKSAYDKRLAELEERSSGCAGPLLHAHTVFV